MMWIFTRQRTLTVLIIFLTFSLNAQLDWTLYSGKIPANAVYGSIEANGTKRAICQCEYQNSTHPGKVVAGACNIGWGGREVAVPIFRVLINNEKSVIRWEKLGDRMPVYGVQGGMERGRKMYVARIKYANGVHSGKVFKVGDKWICTVGYGGLEIESTKDIEVLVATKKPISEVDGMNMTYAQLQIGSDIGIIKKVNKEEWEFRIKGGLATYKEFRRDPFFVYLRNYNGGQVMSIDLLNKQAKEEGKTWRMIMMDVRPIAPFPETIVKTNGRNVTYIEFSIKDIDYRFKQIATNKWHLLSANNESKYFDEIGRDEWSVYLRQVNSNVTMQIDLFKKKINIWEIKKAQILPVGPFVDPIIESNPDTNVVVVNPPKPKNNPDDFTSKTITGRDVTYIEFDIEDIDYRFKQIDTKKWELLSSKNESIYYDEIRRDDWSVYLKEVDSNVTMQVNMLKKKVNVWKIDKAKILPIGPFVKETNPNPDENVGLSEASNEKEAITSTLNKYLDGVGVQIADLTSTKVDDGRNVSGEISILGFNNVILKGELQSNFKVRKLNILFPASASINIEKLTKMIGEASLADFLPTGFPVKTGLSIKSLTLNFQENGYIISQFDAEFGVGDYSIPGFSGFAIDGVDLTFSIENPTKSIRVVNGTIAGNGKVGAIPVSLSAKLSSNPEDILFVSSMKGVNISSILKSFVSDEEVNNFLALIPDVFKNIELSELIAQIAPSTATFSGLGKSTLGEVEIQYIGAKGSRKSSMNFGIAPPSSFKFSDIDATLAPMDGLDLTGTAFVVSSLFNNSYEPSLAALEEVSDLEIRKGFNVFSNIKFGEDLADLLKVETLKLRGTANPTFTSVSMDAALDLNIEFTEEVKMTEVVFGTRMGTAIPIVFSISGMIEAIIDGDRLGFQAGFEFSPTDQQMQGEFFMEALAKKDGTKTIAKMDAAGNLIPPEWTEPFGIPGIGVRKLGASAGIDMKFAPIYLNTLGLTGAARLGTVEDYSKHIEGSVTMVVNITNPIKSLLEIEMKNMTILAIIEAFVEDAGIEGELRKMLDTGLDEAKVLVVPVDGLKAFGKTYDKGIAFGGSFSIAGLKGYMDFSLNDNGIAGMGALDPIKWGDGVFELTGRISDKPQMNFKLLSGSSPELFIDGKVSLLGLSSETTVIVDDNGFELTTAGKIFDLFEAILEVKAKSFSDDGSGFYVRAAMRNDLIERLNKEITKGIDEAAKSTKETLAKNRAELVKARALYKEVDDRITKRTAEITTRRQADLRKMREEAERSMREKQSVLNWHKSKMRSIQKDLNKLSGSNPLHWPEISVLESAILFHKGAIETEEIAYKGYEKTVNGLADIGEDFPIEVELADLYTERTAKWALVEGAIEGLNVVDEVSAATLEAAKWIVDQALGGLFDIKSAEFEGNFGFNNEYKVKINFNVTFTKEPYHFIAEVDFNNLEESAGKIAKDLMAGNLLKKGFAPTFKKNLKTVITSNNLKSKSVGLENISRNPRPLNTYWVTIETASDADAGSKSAFEAVIYGDNGYTMSMLLVKDYHNEYIPNEKVTFSLQTPKNIGNISKVVIVPTKGQYHDNLKIRGISVESKANGKKLHAECRGCNLNSAAANKTISFDGKQYVDYWVTISTNNVQSAGTDSDVYIQFVGSRGKSKRIEISEMVKGNAFERGDLTELPLSFRDIGTLQAVNLTGGMSIDEWTFGGITLRDAQGNVKVNYCNCAMNGNTRNLKLKNLNYYEDYKIFIRTKKGSIFDDYGTDADEFFVIKGNKGVTSRVQGESFLRAKGSLIGENLYANGEVNTGFMTNKDVGTIQSIRIEHKPGIKDDWTFEDIRILKGGKVYQAHGEFTLSSSRPVLVIPLK